MANFLFGRNFQLKHKLQEMLLVLNMEYMFLAFFAN